ncbi:MAG TPA: cell wall-binding repeat-containing protein [Nitriliruptorales bacterium]|nr:cell wall-binding repeat-containing protein [Nitriliruptorales bacterium]
MSPARPLPTALAAALLAAAVLVLPSPRSASAEHLLGAHVSILDAAGPEGDSGDDATLAFTVEAGAPLHTGFTVQYSTVDGTATAADDYVAVADGELTFSPAQSSATLEISLVGDADVEDFETFQVRLTSSSSNVQMTRDTATGTIRNDDPPDLAISDGSAVEGDASVVLFATLTEPMATPVTVDYETVDGTARAGSDYTAANGTLEIPVGGRSGEIRVDVLDDDMPEGNEMFRVVLSNVQNAVLVDAQAEVLFVDDDMRANAGPDETADTEELVAFTGAATGGQGTHRYTWDFGDGSADATGKEVLHGYARAGRYTVTLTVTDGAGHRATDTASVTVTDTSAVRRSSGPTRIETALDVSRDHWTSSLDVVLAYAHNFPDALAAGGFAAGLDAPLLLSEREHLRDDVRAELQRLGAEKVWILGGGAVISGDVEQQLRVLGYRVERIAGDDRFATAGQIALRAGAVRTREVVVALGAHDDENRAWPDALSAGSFAALAEPPPTLLTLPTVLPVPTEQALAELGTSKVWLLGGTAAVAPSVEERLRALGYQVERIAGQHRFDTSAKVAAAVLARRPAGQAHPVFATGEQYPDGLTGGGLAGQVGGPVVLVPAAGLDPVPSVRELVTANADRFDTATVVGGTQAVSEATRQQLEAAMKA